MSTATPPSHDDTKVDRLCDLSTVGGWSICLSSAHCPIRVRMAGIRPMPSTWWSRPCQGSPSRGRPMIKVGTPTELPGRGRQVGEPSPPRYKMVIVTWLGVFPIVTILFSVFGHWLNLLPTLVRTLVFTAVMVTLMTYVVMPRMTRLFSFWLYPDRRE
jgi:hypothetical protein